LKKNRASVSVLEKEAFSQVGSGFVQSRPQFAHANARVNMRVAKAPLNLGDGMANQVPLLLIQGFDFGAEVLVQLDVFQSRQFSSNRPFMRVILPAVLRLV
jgi:hypothetical protein